MDFDQVVMESHRKWLKMNFVKKQKQKQNKKFLEQSSVIGTVICLFLLGHVLSRDMSGFAEPVDKKSWRILNL